MNPIFSKILLIIFLSPGASLGAIVPEGTFSGQEHCVAYETKKKLLLIKSVKVIGRNCDISSEVIPEPGEKFHVEVSIPILSFESGEVERDRDVAKLLKVEEQKDLNFHSESLTKDHWNEKIAAKDFDLKGELIIGGKPFPVIANIHVEETENKKLIVEGRIASHFSDFNLKPPKLWGGIGAQVSKDLNLFFRLQPEKTLGSSFLLK